MQFPRRPAVSWTGPVVMLVATFVGWFAFADAIGDEGDDVAFGLFIGSVSILFMAWSNLLSTRARFLEPVFGGLDRMYRWHRWFGALSVAAMWLHIETIDEVKGIRGASKDIADAAEDLAGTGETLLYILVIVSLIRWVPYRWWRQSHKLMIIPFVFSSWHFHTATKPYANSDPWGRWFQVLMVMGIAAWVHRVLWRDGIRRGRRYQVADVRTSGGVTTIDLAPRGRPLKHRVGQFVFLRIDGGALSEPHPFTIASHPSAPHLRVHVKDLGDWSARLGTSVQVGQPVRVEGPYGALSLFPTGSSTHGPVVWVAGGVGITPFLGAASDAGHHGFVPHLFYAVRSRDSAVGLDELQQAHDAGRIVLHLHVSSEGSRLHADDLVAGFPAASWAGAHVVMCGPDTLINQMRRALAAVGARHVHVEAFDIRTGVGPDLSVEWNDAVRAVRTAARARRGTSP